MITFIAPFPKPGDVYEGWMSRIAAVDRIFCQKRRRYIQVVEDAPSGLPEPIRVSELVDVYRLNLSFHSHYHTLRTLVLQSDMVYVHTIHLSRYVLPFYETGKIVTDIHGVTPEEELLYGKPGPARFYEEIERIVLANSRHAVVVTRAMADHYRAKYPASPCEFTVLPIFETIYKRGDQRLNQQAIRQRPKVLYSGGAQNWQNVDLMLDLAKERIASSEFSFLTNEPERLLQGAKARGIEGQLLIKCMKKEELADVYLDADYGLVLRDDITVNRVACPTKLSEYLWFGVIPIVLSPDLGDFRSLGYRYVSLEDFRSGKLPSAEEQRQMQAKNFEVIANIQNSFEAAADKVRGLEYQLPKKNSNPVTFLTQFERDVLFPAMSELRVICKQDSEPKQVLQEYFIEPDATIEFNIADVDGLRRLTWMPVNRNCQIRLKTVNIEAESGDHVPYDMSGNYDGFSNGVITFSARYPRLDFDISDNMRVRRFTACFEVVFEEKDILTREKDCQIEAILNSWSWRITAPLRILCSFIQAISNKIRAL